MAWSTSMRNPPVAIPAASAIESPAGIPRVNTSDAAHAATVVTRWPPGLMPEKESKSKTNRRP